MRVIVGALAIELPALHRHVAGAWHERQEPFDLPLQQQHRCVRHRLLNLRRVSDGNTISYPGMGAAAESDFSGVLRWAPVLRRAPRFRTGEYTVSRATLACREVSDCQPNSPGVKVRQAGLCVPPPAESSAARRRREPANSAPNGVISCASGPVQSTKQIRVHHLAVGEVKAEIAPSRHSTLETSAEFILTRSAWAAAANGPP